jgi:transcriptional regulator GlxA family with amidase domain
MSAVAKQRISFVVFPDALLLDLAGPLEVFALANETGAARGALYETAVASTTGGLVRTSSGVEINTIALAALPPSDTIIVVGGWGVHVAARDHALSAWVADQAASARRICSVCTGAFVLAASGLLDRRRAVTHWESCGLLQKQHPSTTVVPDAMYLQDGQIWTSAGATAGIDLALALLEADCGRREAIRVARKLVVFLKRSGGQAQFSVPLRLQADGDGSFDALHDWVQAHLSEDLSVDALAMQAGMSPRNFARLYTGRTGRTPAKTVEGFRLEAARRALEDTRLTVKEIAVRCGFLEEDRMRRCFNRRLGVNPQDYRNRFC